MLRNTLLAAAAVAGLAGTAQAQTEITWWHAMGGALGEAVNEIAVRFNAAQSDVVITPIYKGNYEETLTATIAAFRAGEQPNIVQVFEAGAATLIGAKGAVIPVEDLMNNFGQEFNGDDYIEGVRYFYADESGKMVGMPFNSSTPILYYNIEALEKAGVTPPKTWEEFASVTAPALKEAGYVPAAQSHLPWIFTENFHSRHNLQFATENNGFGDGVPQLLVNNDALKAHFSAVKEWVDAGLFGYYGAGWGDNQSPFENGEVAMWMGSSASFGGLRKSMADTPFSATFLPYWEAVNAEPTNTFIGGAALWALSGKSQEENEATAAFFAFLTSAEAQAFWHKATGYVPITKEAYEMVKAEGYYDEVPQAEIGIQQLSLPGGEWSRGYRLGFYVQVRDIMNREYGKIMAGEATVDEAFAVIEEEGNKLLDRFAKTTN